MHRSIVESRVRSVARSLAHVIPIALCLAAAPASARTSPASLSPERRAVLLARGADPTLDLATRLLSVAAARDRRIAVPGVASAALPATALSTASTPFGGCGEWSEWYAKSNAFVRDGHAMVYQTAGDRLLVFGGLDDTSNPVNDVWQMPLAGTPAWSPLAVAGTPPPAVDGATAIYDAARNRVIVFGGTDYVNAPSNAVWTLSLAGTPTWSQLAPGGTAPPGRYGHTAVYDAAGDRMIVFGGWAWNAGTQSGDVANDAWTLSLAPGGAWTPLATTGTTPPARTDAVAAYDAPRNRMVVFGGSDTAGTPLADVWALSPAGTGSWTSITALGSTVPGTVAASAVFDPAGTRMIVFGGYTGAAWAPTGATWALALAGTETWSQLASTGTTPPHNANQAMAYDGSRAAVHVFGGVMAGDETWRLALSGTPAWSEVQVPGAVPQGRSGHGLVVDTRRRRIVMFGGWSSRGKPLSDVWAHALAGGPWARVYANGPQPLRADFAAAYDSVGDALVVSAGTDDAGDFVNTSWKLSFTGTPTWTALSPGGGQPPARTQATGSFDRTRRRMLVTGGLDTNGDPVNVAWALSLSGSGSWAKLSISGSPPSADWTTAIVDELHDRLVVVGPDNAYLATVWTLPLASGGWTKFTATADSPPLTFTSPAGYDRPGNRALVSSLEDAGVLPITLSTRVFALSLAGTPAWSRVGWSGAEPPAHESGGNGVVCDPTASRMVIAGGLLASGPVRGATNDIWTLESGGGEFPLTLVASPVSGGSVAASPAADCQSAGASVQVAATPAAGFVFDHWSGDASGIANPLTFTMDGPKTIQANFSQAPPACHLWRYLGLTSDQLPLDLPVIVRDPVAGRLLAYGRDASNVPVMRQMSLATLSDWQPFAPSGTMPPAIGPGAIFYDPVRNRLVHYAMGGINNGQLWQLTLTGTPKWSQFTAAGTPPPPRWNGNVVYDALRDRLLLFGGVLDYNTINPADFLNDVWALSLSGTPTWTELETMGAYVAPRYGALALYDPVRDRLVVVRGTQYPYTAIEDVMALTLSGTPTWSNVQGVPHSPFPVGGFYDPARDRLVFAAWPIVVDDNAPEQVTALSLATATWTTLSATGVAPPKLQGPGIEYDPDDDRMIVTGGFKYYGGAYTVLHRTYEFLLSTLVLRTDASPATAGWVERSPNADCIAAGTNVTLTAHPFSGFVFDHWAGDLSGSDNPVTLTVNGNVATTAVFTQGIVAAAIERFDAVRDGDHVAISFAIGAGITVSAVTVERADDAAGPWVALAGAAQARDGGFVVTDRDADAGRAWFYRLVLRLANGSTTMSEPVRVDAVGRGVATGIVALGPNPGAAIRVEYALSRETAVRLSVFDVTGREVAVLAHGRRSAGQYHVTFGSPGTTGRLAAGIYVVRLAADGRIQSRRVAIVP